jgi:TonB-dependent SusC/RagA subfamily outer membrane receptor
MQISNDLKAMRFRLILLFCLSAFCFNVLTGQEDSKRITITGNVVDADGKPIENAIVMVDGKKTNTITDYKGNYKIRVKPGCSEIGIFTFGSGIIEEYIDERTVINFTFKIYSGRSLSGITAGSQEIPYGEESVDIGYGHIKRKNLTTDISFIDGTNKKYSSYSTIYDMIQREVSGVLVKNHVIIIQGSRNMFGSVPPLFVVDGTYTDDISYISPQSVKSISVLKGTAAAIYGSRGFGGAIVIRTKTYDD